MLELRPSCECCGTDLGPAAEDAWICSFECTFCGRCKREVLGGKCPNCSGVLQRRPTRSQQLVAKYPPSTLRLVKSAGCKSGSA